MRSPSLLSAQVRLLHEIAATHGKTGRVALRWCVDEGLLERVGRDGYRLTIAGQATISDYLRGLHPVRNSGIVVARSMSEALR